MKNLVILVLAVVAALSISYCYMLKKERDSYKDLSNQYLLGLDSLNAVVEMERARATIARDLAMAAYEKARMAADEGGAEQD